jgi:hypothetical protein
MEAAEGFAREHGERGLFLDTLDFQARPFYERLGCVGPYRFRFNLLHSLTIGPAIPSNLGKCMTCANCLLLLRSRFSARYSSFPRS